MLVMIASFFTTAFARQRHYHGGNFSRNHWRCASLAPRPDAARGPSWGSHVVGPRGPAVVTRVVLSVGTRQCSSDAERRGVKAIGLRYHLGLLAILSGVGQHGLGKECPRIECNTADLSTAQVSSGRSRAVGRDRLDRILQTPVMNVCSFAPPQNNSRCSVGVNLTPAVSNIVRKTWTDIRSDVSNSTIGATGARCCFASGTSSRLFLPVEIQRDTQTSASQVEIASEFSRTVSCRRSSCDTRERSSTATDDVDGDGSARRRSSHLAGGRDLCAALLYVGQCDDHHRQRAYVAPGMTPIELADRPQRFVQTMCTGDLPHGTIGLPPVFAGRPRSWRHR